MGTRNVALPLEDWHFYAVESATWRIALASARALLTAGVVAAAGAYLAKQGVLTADATKAISTMSMRVTIPALLFSKMLVAVNADMLCTGWIMLVLPLVYVLAGCALGFATTCFTPPHLRRSAVAAIAFGNSTGMPLVLLSVIHEELSSAFLDHEKEEGRAGPDPIAYLSLYLCVYPMVQWPLGFHLLRPVGEAAAAGGSTKLLASPRRPPAAGGYARLDESEPRDSTPVPVVPVVRSYARNLNSLVSGEFEANASTRASVAAAVEGVFRVLSAARASTVREEDQDDAKSNAYAARTTQPPPPPLPPPPSAVRTALREAWHFLGDLARQALVPPVVATLIGAACGVTPPLRRLLLPSCSDSDAAQVAESVRECEVGEEGVDPPLGWLVSGMLKLGAAAVPINLILLGASLAKGPNWQAVTPGVIVTVCLCKMLLMPLVGLTTVYLIDRSGLLQLESPWDEPLYLAALVVTCTPTANNIIVLSEQAGGDRAAVSTIVFAQYLCAPLLLTLSVTCFVMFVSRDDPTVPGPRAWWPGDVVY